MQEQEQSVEQVMHRWEQVSAQVVSASLRQQHSAGSPDLCEQERKERIKSRQKRYEERVIMKMIPRGREVEDSSVRITDGLVLLITDSFLRLVSFSSNRKYSE